jgi:hypothetical protein
VHQSRVQFAAPEVVAAAVVLRFRRFRLQFRRRRVI